MDSNEMLNRIMEILREKIKMGAGEDRDFYGSGNKKKRSTKAKKAPAKKKVVAKKVVATKKAPAKKGGAKRKVTKGQNKWINFKE